MTISRTRTTQWNLFFHYVSIALMMVSGVLLVPIYLHQIPLALYGAWLATGNVLMWLTAVDPGLSAALQQRIGSAYGQRDHQAVRGFIFAGLLLSAGATLILVLLGNLIEGHIPGWLNLANNEDTNILLHAFGVAVIGSCLLLFSYSITAINQGLQSSLGIGSIYVVVHALDIILILVLIYNGFGLMALAYSALFRGMGMLLGNAAYLAWRLTKENIGFSFSTNKLRELSRLMPFTFLAQASGVVANNIDAFVTARFLGPEIVPVLVLTRKAIEICRTFVSRPAMAFAPSLSHLVGTGETEKAKQVLFRLVRIMIWLLLLVASGLMSFNEEFVRLWVGSNLFAGGVINTLLCAGLLLGVLTTSLSNLCMALGNIKGASIATLVQSIIFMLLVVVGAKYFGLVGVTLAPLLAMGLIGAWYFPQAFADQLQVSADESRVLIYEAIRSTIAVVPVSLLFAFVGTESIAGFIAHVMMFAIGYGVALSVVSSAFRLECANFYRKFASRLNLLREIH